MKSFTECTEQHWTNYKTAKLTLNVHFLCIRQSTVYLKNARKNNDTRTLQQEGNWQRNKQLYTDKQERKQNTAYLLMIMIDLPLTVMDTFWLLDVPAVLFATHLYVKLPLFITILLNIPELLLPNRTSFSKKWYIAGGFALAEQLKSTTSFGHALLAETFVVNCTSSGLTEKRRDRHRDTLIWKEL